MDLSKEAVSHILSRSGISSDEFLVCDCNATSNHLRMCVSVETKL